MVRPQWYNFLFSLYSSVLCIYVFAIEFRAELISKCKIQIVGDIWCGIGQIYHNRLRYLPLE